MNSTENCYTKLLNTKPCPIITAFTKINKGHEITSSKQALINM